MYDFAVIGGGIVGLSVGMHLTERFTGARVLLLEKEDHWAAHQTGHNSGVIHSGIYYKPGSFKARFAVDGNRQMVEFCQEHGIAHDVCGKIIVATEDWELPLLDNLMQRGIANGLRVTRIGPEQIREIEPHCRGLAALLVPSTGIADFKAVARKYAELMQERDAELRLGCRMLSIDEDEGGPTLVTTQGNFKAKFLINCCGLHSDRVARMDGVDPGAKIVPFRGEYYELKPERRSLVRNLIYPVPNPDFPFLGVHFTRMTDGNIHCGPNAVLAMKREGYSWRDFSARDLCETLGYAGFRKLAAQNFREGVREVWRSFSKRAFTRSLQRLIPEIQADDLIPSHSGVRAQALLPDGKLVDDFLIVSGRDSMHVCNAPSPAATASISIGREVVQRIPSPARTRVAISA